MIPIDRALKTPILYLFIQLQEIIFGRLVFTVLLLLFKEGITLRLH
jgi:hypothetical protein